MDNSKHSVLPFYAVGAFWLLYGLLFRINGFFSFLIPAALSFALFCILRPVCDRSLEKKEAKAKEEAAKRAEEEAKQAKKTGNEALDKMIEDGEKAIAELKRLDDAIEDEKISEDIRKMESTCQKIFDQVQKQPEQLPQIRRFMDYYLPTTLKILNSYDRMGNLGVDGENVTTTLTKIEQVMDTIVSAFDKQLDALFGSEAMDISTDITVLDNILAREGLGENPLQNTPTLTLN